MTVKDQAPSVLAEAVRAPEDSVYKEEALETMAELRGRERLRLVALLERSGITARSIAQGLESGVRRARLPDGEWAERYRESAIAHRDHRHTLVCGELGSRLEPAFPGQHLQVPADGGLRELEN